jgi:hypothetical protein
MMAVECGVEVCKTLAERFRSARLYRPMRVRRYDAGAELTYNMKAVEGTAAGRVHLVIEKFVGGGFAGQVYKVKVTDIEGDNKSIGGIEPGGVYAMKILIPPSRLSRLFRNMLYWIGFQGAFALEVNPAAVRAGALWQKFIRRAAKIRLGGEAAVVDIHATFVDQMLGSCGELREWVEGRTWRLEVDDNLDSLKRWKRGKQVDAARLGSPEYRAKKQFMADFVKLLHEVGGHELARQYEWWTCKSQPNCLKREGTDEDPSAGLVAVDFRAGLALLPFLPMSPGDFKLIAKGVGRGSLVQFDRGDIARLEAFVQAHGSEFGDMSEMLAELKAAEQSYRNSVPDVAHNHIRVFHSRELWATMMDSAVTGWKVRNLVDERSERKLRGSRVLTLLFFVIGAIPFLGKFVRRIWARDDWYRHYASMLEDWGYFKRAVDGRIAEKVIVWHRAGRLNKARSLRVAGSLRRFLCHLPLSILPAGLHRFLTDWSFFKDKLHYIFVRPFKLYFSAKLREEWLREMVAEGKGKHILTEDDAETILSQLKERYIQRYLISLVVHLLTLPVTQIVFGIIGYYVAKMTGSVAAGVLTFGVGQIIPISPGSICRGLWAVGLAIYDRDFKNYNIAVFLSFVKYIGYLAFPIQMTYRYPELARFMAAHWATGAIRVVPVFGESGALLEHWVFRLFYNWPLTIRRRMRRRAEIRSAIRPRYWHIGLCAVAAAGMLWVADFVYFKTGGGLPRLVSIWWVVTIVPLVGGAAVTLGCGGSALWKRVVGATVCGILAGLLYAVMLSVGGYAGGLSLRDLVSRGVYATFIFAILSTIGAMITELKLPDPDLRR